MKTLMLASLLLISSAAVNADPFRVVQPDVYGPGMGMDQTGRVVPHGPAQNSVQRDAYGLGMGMDKYGRPAPGNVAPPLGALPPAGAIQPFTY